MRTAIRLPHYSRRTEEAYIGWIRRFIVASGTRHPREMGKAEVKAFLGTLAARCVTACTQNQALSAILFLYEVVRGWTDVRRWSSVAGMRRVTGKGLSLDRGELTVRDGKNGKDRVTMLPTARKQPLTAHCARSIPTRHASGRGNGSFPRRVSTSTAKPGSAAAITSMNRYRPAGRSKLPCGRPASRGRRPATHSATLSPLTCSKPATTFGPSRTAWPPRRQHDDDLHARAQPRGRSAESCCLAEA